MVFSGACDAGLRLVIKLTRVHKFTLTAGGFLLALPYYIIWLFLVGTPPVAQKFWIALLVHTPLFVVANVLAVEAHRSSPLILTMPYLALTPAFLLLTAPVMGAGTPTWLGGLGVLILTAGVYLLNFESSRASPLAPFRALTREKGSRLMVAVAFLFSITANLDYIGLTGSSSPFWLLADHGTSGLVMAGVAIYSAMKNKEPDSIISPRGSWPALWLYGGMIGALAITHMMGLELIKVVPYAIAVKRSGGIIFTVLSGLFLGFVKRHRDFEGERKNLQFRLPGVLLMVAGMVVVILWGKK